MNAVYTKGLKMQFDDNQTLILRINITDYFFPWLNKSNIFPCYKGNINYIERFLNKICTCFHYSCGITFSEWKNKVSNARRVILFDYGYSSLITKYIKAVNKKCIVHLYCFNVMSADFSQQVINDRNIDYIWSFDPGDVDKYGICFNTAMYSLNLFKDPVKGKSNKVVFVGAAKNREKHILDLKYSIESAGGFTDFHIIRSNKEYMSYSKYLSLIDASDCILDVTKEGQLGLTLRFMESIFLSKKLITNNIEVKKQKFYNPNNIFIVGCDALNDLRNFLRSDYVPIPKSLIEYYDFENWIKRFVEVEHV